MKKDLATQDTKLRWKVNTHSLLEEIATNNGVDILKIPLNIFQDILAEVATRATEINDAKLNGLMCRLALYGVSDPYETDSYNAEITQQAIEGKHGIDCTKLSDENIKLRNALQNLVGIEAWIGDEKMKELFQKNVYTALGQRK